VSACHLLCLISNFLFKNHEPSSKTGVISRVFCIEKHLETLKITRHYIFIISRRQYVNHSACTQLYRPPSNQTFQFALGEIRAAAVCLMIMTLGAYFISFYSRMHSRSACLGGAPKNTIFSIRKLRV
jgi:hypothetical protein